VHELDRSLDGNDVIGARGVDEVHHRRQRRALARTGGTGHEHEALGQVAEVPNALRQVELIGGEHAGRDETEDPARPMAVHEDVAAQPRQSGDFVSEVGVMPFLELPTIALGHDLPDQFAHLRGVEHRELHGRDVPVQAQCGLAPRAEVQIARLLLDHDLEQVVQFGHTEPLPSTARVPRRPHAHAITAAACEEMPL